METKRSKLLGFNDQVNGKRSKPDRRKNDATRCTSCKAAQKSVNGHHRFRRLDKSSASLKSKATMETKSFRSGPRLRPANDYNGYSATSPEGQFKYVDYFETLNERQNTQHNSLEKNQISACVGEASSTPYVDQTIEIVDLGYCNANDLPEIDKHSLEVLLANINSQSIAAIEESDLLDEDDARSPIDDQAAHDYFSSQCIENLHQTKFDDILREHGDLLDQIGNVLDGGFYERDGVLEKPADFVTSYESTSTEIQASTTTQCDFAEERERDRRKRNNMASRKSRATRKERYTGMEAEKAKLQLENDKLRASVREMEEAIEESKAIVFGNILGA